MSLSMNFFGNEDRAKSHRGEVMNLIYKLETRKKLSGLDLIWSPVHTLLDGTTVKIEIAYDKITAFVTAPFGEEVIPEEVKLEVLGSELLFICGDNYYLDGSVYRYDSFVRRLHPLTGTILWQKTVKSPSDLYSVRGKVAANATKVFTVSTLASYPTNEVYLEARGIDGNYLWSKTFSGEMADHETKIRCDKEVVVLFSAEVSAGGIINNSVVRCMDTKGAIKWEYRTFPLSGVIFPYDTAISKTAIYVVYGDEFGQHWNVVALDKITGSVIWSKSETYYDYEVAWGISYKSGFIYTSGLVIDYSPYTLRSRVECRNASDGSLVWYREELSTSSFSYIGFKNTVDNKRVYATQIAAAYSTFPTRSYDKRDGTDLWLCTHSSWLGYYDIADSSTLVYGCGSDAHSKGILSAIKKRTGEIVWDHMEATDTNSSIWGVCAVKIVL